MNLTANVLTSLDLKGCVRHGLSFNFIYEKYVTCHLAEVAVPHTVCYLLDLSLLISQTLLFIELLSQSLKLSESQLQGQPVSVGLCSVFQHVLK